MKTGIKSGKLTGDFSSIEILIIILVSFSPLIPQLFKGLLTIALVLMNYRYIIKNSKRSILRIAPIIIILLLGAIIDIRNVSNLSEYSSLNFYIPISFTLGFIISEKYKIESFLTRAERIIFVSAVFSLVGVFLYYLYPNFILTLPNYKHYFTTHKTAIVFNVLVGSSGIIKRNTGIAWEPGIFQLLLNLGLYTSLRYWKPINIARVIVYVIAVFFTRSTAGLIVCSIILAYYMRNNRAVTILIATIFIIALGPIISEVRYQLEYKLISSTYFLNRITPSLNAFKTGVSRFWGFGNSGYNDKYILLGLGAWDSFGQIFIRYGYLLLTALMIYLIALSFISPVLIMILFTTMLSQGIWHLPFVTIFYFIIRKRENCKDESIMVVKRSLS